MHSGEKRIGLGISPGTLIIVLAFLLVAISVTSLMLGQMSIPVGTILKIFASQLIQVDQSWSLTLESVLFEVRLPRLLAGILVGAKGPCGGMVAIPSAHRDCAAAADRHRWGIDSH